MLTYYCTYARLSLHLERKRDKVEITFFLFSVILRLSKIYNMKLEGTGQETNICRNLLCTRHPLGTLCTLAYRLLRNQLENVGEGALDLTVPSPQILGKSLLGQEFV